MNVSQLLQELTRYDDQMNARERAIAYERGEQVDRLPVSISSHEMRASLFGYTMGEYRRSFDVRADVYEHMHHDFGTYGICIGTGLKKIGEALGAIPCFPEHSADYLLGPAIENYWQSPQALEVPNPRKNPVLLFLLEEVARWQKRFGSDFSISTDVAGPMTTAAFICDLTDMMTGSFTHPERLRALLDFAVECQLEWVRVLYDEYGIQSAGIADPVATQTIWGPDQFQKFAKPALVRLSQGIKAITQKSPSLHICGKTRDIWPDLKELQCSSFLVDELEDIGALKHALGGEMRISGNVSPVHVLLNGSIADVIASAKNCMLKAADSPKGYTLAAGCQTPAGVPKENLYAMLLAAKKYGRLAQKGKLPLGLFECC